MTGSREDAYRAAGVALATRHRTRRVDELAVRAVAALTAEGVPSLLLRGPAIARLLYDGPGERSYQDVDLLVAARDHERAGHALLRVGLRPVLEDAAESEASPHARTYEAGDGDVDLHWTLKGVGARPEAAWAALSRDAEPLELCGSELSVPSAAARALIVALHASQHGPQGPVQLDDVRRALERLPRETWAAAAELARELEAHTWFAGGLRQVAGGAELLGELGMDTPADLEVAVRGEGNVPMVRGFAELSTTPGAGGKARLLAREMFPTRGFMREWSPMARRGGAGLAAAYAYRPFWLASRAVPAYRAYRRARRSVK